MTRAIVRTFIALAFLFVVALPTATLSAPGKGNGASGDHGGGSDHGKGQGGGQGNGHGNGNGDGNGNGQAGGQGGGEDEEGPACDTQPGDADAVAATRAAADAECDC